MVDHDAVCSQGTVHECGYILRHDTEEGDRGCSSPCKRNSFSTIKKQEVKRNLLFFTPCPQLMDFTYFGQYVQVPPRKIQGFLKCKRNGFRYLLSLVQTYFTVVWAQRNK